MNEGIEPRITRISRIRNDRSFASKSAPSAKSAVQFLFRIGSAQREHRDTYEFRRVKVFAGRAKPERSFHSAGFASNPRRKKTEQND